MELTREQDAIKAAELAAWIEQVAHTDKLHSDG